MRGNIERYDTNSSTEIRDNRRKSGAGFLIDLAEVVGGVYFGLFFVAEGVKLPEFYLLGGSSLAVSVVAAGASLWRLRQVIRYTSDWERLSREESQATVIPRAQFNNEPERGEVPHEPPLRL